MVVSRLDRHTRPIVCAATSGPRDAQPSIEARVGSGPNRERMEDDLLLLSIHSVKEARRDGPNFVAEVALVFWTLRAELEDAELAEAM
jgi:hypothetical protein